MAETAPMEVDPQVVKESVPKDPTEAEFEQSTVGIDLGDLYCRVSLMTAEAQIPDTVRNNLSNEKTPSVVSFRMSQERQFGDEAVSILTSQPSAAINNLKTIVATPLSKEFCASSQLLFEVDSDANTIEVSLEPESKLSLAPIHILAMLFKRLLHYCRQFKRISNQMALPSSVIVSVPSSFSDAQKSAVRDALQIAGLPGDKAVVLTEAYSQLLCFHHSHYSELHASNPKSIVLVDIGHSHSSVVLGKVSKVLINCDAAESSSIGSRSVDIAIARDCIEYIKEKYGLDISKKPKQVARILREAQKCKEMLSMLDSTQVTVESLTDEIDLMFPVKKETIVDHAALLGDTLVELCQKVMTAVPGMTLEQVDRVEVLGGGILMPYLQERLREFWQRPLSTTMDGSLTTSRGCALYGVVKEPTAETTSILDSIISKADEVRRLMETLHHVKLTPEVAQPLSLPEHQLQSFLALEEELERRDNRYIGKATARNAVEEYIYGMRNHMANPDMKKALGDNLQHVVDVLNKAEDWLMSEGEDVDADVYHAKLTSTKSEMQERFPAIQKELERQQEEQAKRDAELAAEALKAQAENKKEPRTDGERIKFAEERKEQGNNLFKQEHYAECITRYVQALGYLGEIYSSSDEEMKKKKDEISFSCYLNVAAAAIKTGMYQRAVENCNKALEINKGSAKAYFRKGQALVAKQEWDDAKKELTKALELAPGDKAIEKELVLLQKKVEQHKQKEKKMFANMFK